MRDVGACEEDGFGGCGKLLSPVVHVALDTLLAKAPSLVDNCTFRDRIDENVAGGSSCLRTHSSSSLCARPAALQLQH